MKNRQEIICIGCPMGCTMSVDVQDGAVVSVVGNSCKRGETYAQKECTNPERMVTSLIRVAEVSLPLSVKTRTAVPKSRVADCLRAIRAAKVNLPVRMGDVIVPNVCGTGVDVVATREIAQ